MGLRVRPHTACRTCYDTPPPPAPRISLDSDQQRLTANLTTLYVVKFLFFCHLGTGVTVPFLRDWGGLSYLWLMAAEAWFMFATLLLEVPSGAFADRFGRRNSMVAGGLVGMVGAFVYTASPELGTIVAGTSLFAIAAALFSGADSALLYDTLRRLGRAHEAAQLFARLDSIRLVGFMIGAVTGSLIAEHRGVETAQFWRWLPFSLSALSALALSDPGRAGRAGAPGGWLELVRAGVGALRRPVLRRMVLHYVLPESFLLPVLWAYQPLSEGVGIGIGWFGSIHATLALAQILVLLRIRQLQSRFGGRDRLLWLGAVIAGGCLAATGMARHPALLLLLLVVTVSFGLIRRPVVLAALNEHIEENQRATVLSAVNMVRMAGVGVGLLLMGAGLEHSLPFTVFALGISAAALSTTTRLTREQP